MGETETATITIPTQEYEALQRQVAGKRQSESIWNREKKKLQRRIVKEFGEYKAYQITDAIATIARRALHKKTVVTFTEADVEVIWQMYYSIIAAMEETN